MAQVIDRLSHGVREGFLLHGSNVRSHVIEPRQAYDTIKKSIGNRWGVYATTDLRVAIAKAVVRPIEGRAWRWGYRTAQGRFLVYGRNVRLGDGIVHFLPADDFRWVNDGDHW